jgi:hypothetical protein
MNVAYGVMIPGRAAKIMFRLGGFVFWRFLHESRKPRATIR